MGEFYQKNKKNGLLEKIGVIWVKLFMMSHVWAMSEMMSN